MGTRPRRWCWCCGRHRCLLWLGRGVWLGAWPPARPRTVGTVWPTAGGGLASFYSRRPIPCFVGLLLGATAGNRCAWSCLGCGCACGCWVLPRCVAMTRCPSPHQITWATAELGAGTRHTRRCRTERARGQRVAWDGKGCPRLRVSGRRGVLNVLNEGAPDRGQRASRARRACVQAVGTPLASTGLGQAEPHAQANNTKTKKKEKKLFAASKRSADGGGP